MSANTSIQWTDKTWNPVRGCSVVSPGCVHCYAMKVAHRFSGEGKPYVGLTKQTKAGPQWTGTVVTVDGALREPLSWRKPCRVFVNSMSDLFHEDVPDQFIAEVLGVTALAERHTFQILTKRAARMRDVVAWWIDRYHPVGPLANVWLGVSVENQHYADERMPLLLQTPAAVRFISAEPLLGPVNIERWLRAEDCNHPEQFCEDVGCRGETWLDWVIVGGESGPGARPFDLAWARSIVAQCKFAGVKCFVKQLGAKPRGICAWPHHNENPPMWFDDDGVLPSVSKRQATDLCHAVDDRWWPCSLKLKDRMGGQWSEWPEDLRVREFPEVRA